jgi:chromate transporter
MISLSEVSKIYLTLGLTAFGGPTAHIAYLHDVFVEKKQWLSDQVFAELFAISASLPGPASTQLAYSIALLKGGPLIGVYAFLLWRFIPNSPNSS